MGKGTRPVLGGGRDCPLSFLVAIAIVAIQEMQILGVDIEPVEVKTWTGTNSNTSYMCSCILARGNDSLDQVTRLKTVAETILLGSRAWESERIHETHLTTLSAFRRNEQRRHLGEMDLLRSACSHTCSIDPMHLGQVSCEAVIRGSATGPTLDRQVERFEALIECPSRCVHSSSILEGGFGLGKHAPQHLRFILEEFSKKLCAFLVVARPTGKGEVAHTVTSAPCSAYDMSHLQWDIVGPTIRTVSPPLLEQVCSEFVPC